MQPSLLSARIKDTISDTNCDKVCSWLKLIATGFHVSDDTATRAQCWVKWAVSRSNTQRKPECRSLHVNLHLGNIQFFALVCLTVAETIWSNGHCPLQSWHDLVRAIWSTQFCLDQETLAKYLPTIHRAFHVNNGGSYSSQFPLDNTRIDTVGRYLGYGSHSTVRYVNGKAVKTYKDVGNAFHEFVLLQALQECPTVPRAHSLHVSGTGGDLVMEYGQPLPLTLSPRDQRLLLRDIAEALAFAHRHSIVHRDIKPSNILRNTERFLLIDWSNSEYSDQPLHYNMTSPWYRSLEDLHIDHFAHYVKQSDMWALGLTVLQLVHGRFPTKLKQHDQRRLRDNILEMFISEQTILSRLPDNVVGEVIKSLLTLCPENRMTADAVVKKVTIVKNKKNS